MRLTGPSLVLLLAATLFSGLGCSKTPATVTVAPPKVEIVDIGGAVQLKATVNDAKGEAIEEAPVTFVSADPKIAEVEADGRVTALASGDTEITVTSGPASARVRVKTRLISRLGLAMPHPGDAVAAGVANGLYPLTVTALDEAQKPADFSHAVWTSSAPAVATVDQGGVLTLLSAGQTVITAQIGKTVAKLPVSVMILVPMAIKLEAPTFSVRAGESAPLAFSVVSDKGTLLDITPAFISSAPEVVAVDAKGSVTGLKRGTAQVKIQIGEAVNTVTVTVR